MKSGYTLDSQYEIRQKLAKTFAELMATYKDTEDLRLLIAKYTMGYMGVSYGLTTQGGING